MCLSGVKVLPKKVSSFGYKVFQKSGNLLFCDTKGNIGIPLKVGVFINEVACRFYIFRGWDCLKCSGGSGNYPFGFHVFKYKKDAMKWMAKSTGVRVEVIRKVEMRGIHTFGNQMVNRKMVPCFVCSEIKILEGDEE